MEFLGDSILNFLGAEYVYNAKKQMREGDLTVFKSQIVANNNLAAFGRKIQLGKYLRLGHGEMLQNGQCKMNILADAVEAVIAAYYLDGGIDAARSFILGYIYEIGEQLDSQHKSCARDSKSELQLLTQHYGYSLPVYSFIAEKGPAHYKYFAIRVLALGKDAEGVGLSKKEAEQAAAAALLAKLKRGVED